MDSELKSELTSYQTSLVAIQEDAEADDSGSDEGTGDETGNDITGDIIHNFTESGLSSTYFNITGNLSDSKGTVTYGDLSLTQCLKIESSTNISFSTTEEATITLIFNEDYLGRIKIDGVNYTASFGEVSIALAAGEHTITKADVANLYLISLAFSTTDISAKVSEPVYLYPNPVSNLLNIRAEVDIHTVEVYALTGKLVLKTVFNKKAVDLSDLPKGIYLVKVISASDAYQKSILKR